MMKVIWYVISIALLIPASMLSQTEQNIGDAGDGNRSKPVHLIKLYDELGHLVMLDDKPALPFSEKETCKKCHDYSKIQHGWHFNASDSGVAAGRVGEPWILVDPLAATQIPVSYRSWIGAYSPDSLGLSTLQFLAAFGHHSPGGGVGENESHRGLDDYLRWQISGNLDVSCQSCHSIDPGQSQAEYALQIVRQNFRWAATGSSGFSTVLGTAREMPGNFDIYSAVPAERSEVLPPTVSYNRSKFDNAGRVLFDVVRRPPAERCYFCHSMKVVDPIRQERWQQGEDVHVAAGMVCVDCHHNGLDHQMVRGYDGEAEIIGKPAATSFTCKGCHLGSGDAHGSRRSAPRPLHLGIPPVHFERLTCTACHSGPTPRDRTFRVKTSRAHALGLPVPDKADDALPQIVAPVFARQPDGRIAPHALVWPAFWAYAGGTGLHPLPPKVVRPLIQEIFLRDTSRSVGRWVSLTETDLRNVLNQLWNLDSTWGTPVYVSGGKLFVAGPGNTLESRRQEGTGPFAWPLAHDVRPKEQALGANGCDDCHSGSAPFYFGEVVSASPFVAKRDSVTIMTEYQDRYAFGPWLFSMSFLFRPLLKALVIVSFLVISAVVIVYIGRGISAILQSVGGGEE